MSDDFFSDRRHAQDRDRAAFIKARMNVDDVVDVLGLASDMGVVSPCCGAFGMLKTSRDGDTWKCESPGCDDTGDIISLVKIERGVGFREACRILEAELPQHQRRCAKTGDMFG